MTDWQTFIVVIAGGACVGMLWNISDKMDKIYKLLLERMGNG